MALSDHMTMNIELRLSCEDLPSSELPSGFKTTIVVKEKDLMGKFREIGQTETLDRVESPVFSKPILLPYKFEEVQTLKFELCDVDVSDSDTPADDVFLGEVVATLGQIVAGKQKKMKLLNTNSDSSGTIAIAVHELTNVNEVEFVVHGTGLVKKDFLGKSDPYLVIQSKHGYENRIVYQTEKIKDTRKPKWTPFSIRIQTLCGGNWDTPISFQVFDHDNDGPHSLIGECDATLSGLVRSDGTPPELNLINQKKKLKKKDYKNSGKLIFAQCKVVKKHSFLDYIFGGCQLDFVCGIDFTASNKDPRLSGSLHYMGSVNPNDYVHSIQTFGNVLQDYSKEEAYRAFGYGAKVPPDEEASHDFDLTLDSENVVCKGIEDIITAYSNVLNTVKLWGPTNVAPIINRVAASAREISAADKYFVLLLLTDGVISDKNETLDAIVATSELPISIVFVAIGNADFSAMSFLNGGNLLANSSGQKAKRVNVQFMLFRNFKMSSATALAKTALAQIPQQALEFFYIKDLPPPGNEVQSNDQS